MKQILLVSCLLVGALGSASMAAEAPASDHPGYALYRQHCATCHDHPVETKSVPFDTLRGTRYVTLHYALTRGKMKAQAAPMNEAQVGQLLDYVVGRQVVDDGWIARMQCGADRRTPKLDTSPTIAHFGFDSRNSRALTPAQSGLATADLRNLEPAWALAFPGVTTLRAQPAIVGDTLFLNVGDNARVFALNIAGETPCIEWSYSSDVPTRSGIGFGTIPGTGRKVIVFNDVATQIHLVDAVTGKGLWKQHVGLYDLSNTTGTPMIVGDRVFVPLSASEINVGGDDRHLCCKTHGGFFALDLKTGRKLWTYHTMPEAKPIRDRGDGQMLWGPSGAPIWTSPLIDEKRGLIYVGTGEATSAPAAPTTDSILALDMKTGRLRWKYQATPDDIFLTTCMARPKNLNCPKEGRLLDHDFGATLVMGRDAAGKDVLLAGQKSGMLWALDPDTGKVKWNREFGKGSPIGGIHWGMAFDGERVFVPIHAFPGPDGVDPNQVPGLHAVRVDDGAVQWSYLAKADCAGDRVQRVPTCKGNIGLSTAPTVIDGGVVEGSVDGFLRAFDTKTGELLWQYDTAVPWKGVNGVEGHGGAIDNASIVASHGLLFVNSGYGLMGGQRAGNVFVAFRARKR